MDDDSDFQWELKTNEGSWKISVDLVGKALIGFWFFLGFASGYFIRALVHYAF